MAMSIGSQGQNPQPSQFKLLKYSYVVTSVVSNAPLNWSHLTSKEGLTANFDKYVSNPPVSAPVVDKMLLRVTHEHEVLEQIDLKDIAHETQQPQNQIALSQIGATAKPVVAVVVRSPCIAIRFPTSTGQTHRFQIKFAFEHDYYTALGLLSESGCAFSEPSATAARLSSSQLPPSTSSRFSLLNRQAEPKTDASGKTELSFSSSQSLSSRPTSSFARDPTSRASQKENQVGEREGSYRPSGSGNASLTTPQRPTTAPTLYNSEALDQRLPPKRDLPFSRASERETGNSVSSTRTHLPGVSTSTETVALAPFNSADANSNNQLSHQPVVPNAPFRRPWTTQTQMGPPGSRGSIVHSTDVSGSPLPPRSRSDSHTMDSLHTATGDQSHQVQHSAFIPSCSPYQQPPPCFSLSQPLPSSSTATTNNNEHRSVSMPVPSSLSQRRSAAGQQSFQDPTTLEDPFVDNPTIDTVIRTGDFSEYLKNSDSDRAALVDTWICDQLQDEAFMTLCEDVENVWRRIALGRP